MECPYCSAELEQTDSWGYLASHQSGEVLGGVFKCPNHEGFEDREEAETYQRLEDPFTDINEIVCESAVHYVSGSFYTDKNGDLKNGYPC